MQKLFENWRKYVICEQNEEIVSHNCQFLKDVKVTEELGGIKYQIPGGPGEKFKVEDFCQLVANIPPLQKARLQSFVGSGTVGLVFLLDNGRIFKLFEGKYGSKGEEYDILWYKAITKRQKVGQAKEFEVQLYDFGKLPIDLFPGETGEGLYYVEMEKLLPLTVHYQDSDPRGPLNEDVVTLVEYVFLFYSSKYRNFWKQYPDSPKGKLLQNFENSSGNDAKKLILNNIPDISGPLSSKKTEFVSFLTNFIELYGEKFAGDIHYDNIGLSLDKKTFKIFDVSGG